ncbi:MAG: potassium transporter Kup [Polyangiaceae bacterium]|nr:potassium transporter Kup [Polyangiaceae bacterium]
MSSPKQAPAPAAPKGQGGRPAAHGSLAGLGIAALGVVFGDIGTSPLYALKECFTGHHAVAPDRAGVLGVLSLMLWSLTVVVTVKYVGFIMRADNHGEGGILALLALVPESFRRAGSVMVPVVLVGAALLYGDGVITPAISVLSAVEGLEVATEAMKPVVVPATVVILILLFLVQRKGTAGIGAVFGPIMVLWFLAIAALGVAQIAKNPGVLAALDPRHGANYLLHHGYHGFLVLGSVVLCVTGGEALYADMGHFGPRAIRLAWFGLVMPSLALNYFGQGALILADPAAAKAPFYAIVPRPLLYPMVGMATLATVIASQALISGAYSLTRQAVQLGYCPRVSIVHTSKEQEGQIYIPEINWMLMVACVVLVLAFRESTALAAAYGIAVTGTMGITSIVYFVVITRTWGWGLSRALPLVGFFLAFDLAFFAANIVKFKDGGWVPIAMAAVVFTAMITWKAGRARLYQFITSRTVELEEFLSGLEQRPPPRVEGTAVFMTASATGVPQVMLHHYKHNQVLHEQVVLLTIASEDVPFVSPKHRIQVEELRCGFFRVKAAFGFMETPKIPAILEACAIFGLAIDPETVTFYLGRETLLATRRPGMARWQKALFSFLSRNARTATSYFGIPADRVVELGMQVEL